MQNINKNPKVLVLDNNPSFLGYVDLTTNAVPEWDYTDPNNPVMFRDFFWLSLPMLKTSTNMVNWSGGYSMALWLSSNSVESVLYDSASNSLVTNYMAGNPYSTNSSMGTNFLSLPIFDRMCPVKFFSVVTNGY